MLLQLIYGIETTDLFYHTYTNTPDRLNTINTREHIPDKLPLSLVSRPGCAVLSNVKFNSRFSTASTNPLESRCSYSASSNNMKLVHWPMMGRLLYLVRQGGDWAEPQPAQGHPRRTKCNSPPINGQCTKHRIAVLA